MAKLLTQQLQKYWQGPPVRVLVGNEHYQLGKGSPAVEVVVHDANALRAHALSLSFGEAYTQGIVEVKGELLALLEGYYRTSSVLPYHRASSLMRAWYQLTARTGVRQAVANARHHYDLGNEFYKLWLDPALVYSCAYFLTPDDSLAVAQQQKLELLCRKLRLGHGQRVLDIGCGWGGLLWHAAEKYGAQVTGITPAKQQAEYITAETARRGLTGQVQVIVGDWRQLRGTYDRIVSVGMFEHVGRAQYREFFQRWERLLAPDGISLLHTIGRITPGERDPWMDKYIFPGGYLPTLAEILHHTRDRGLVVADVENLWQHYALTLQHWSANFAAAREQVVRRYDESFARMWWLYLQGSEAAFRWGGLHLWQVVLLKGKSSPWPLNREVRIDSKVG